jgi:hypothetical protein
MCDKEVNQMNEQIQAREPLQRRTVGPTIFMIAGIIFLAASTFILTTGVVGNYGLGALSLGLSIPSIPIGAMLLLIGLVNTTKKPSLRWLRITVSILCGILLGLAVLWFLLVSVLWISGF